jgi:hypothetical protein
MVGDTLSSRQAECTALTKNMASRVVVVFVSAQKRTKSIRVVVCTSQSGTRKIARLYICCVLHFQLLTCVSKLDDTNV